MTVVVVFSQAPPPAVLAEIAKHGGRIFIEASLQEPGISKTVSRKDKRVVIYERRAITISAVLRELKDPHDVQIISRPRFGPLSFLVREGHNAFAAQVQMTDQGERCRVACLSFRKLLETMHALSHNLLLLHAVQRILDATDCEEVEGGVQELYKKISIDPSSIPVLARR